MGTQFLNVDVGRCMINLTNKPNSTMFRFVALFALVAVAFAEPEADAQWLVNPYNTVAGVPVVNKVVQPLVYNQVPVVKPVVNPVVYKHVPAVAPVVKYVDPHHTEGMTKQGGPEKTDSVKIAEKQHELAQQIEKSKVNVGYVAPYTTYAAGYPYTTAVSGYTFPSTYVNHPVVYRGKRDADSDAQLYYSRYASPYAYNYGHPYTYNTPYTYGYNRYGWF